MKNVGLFFGKSTTKTAQAAEMIKKAWGNNIDLINVEECTTEDILKYDHLIFGAATWFDGELPSYWDEMLPEIEEVDLTGKQVAIFGLGDQAGYPDNFVDSIGLLAHRMEKNHATVIGYTSCEGYTYTRSKGECEGRFKGLALDFENQSDLNEKRIKDWVVQLKKEFK